MKRALWILLVPGALCCLLLAAYRDTYSLEVRRYVVTDPELGQTLAGMKIALLADLHVENRSFLESEVLRSLEREKPDLILLAGDYIRSRGPYEPALDVLRRMKAPLGVYAVLGNMDYTNEKGSCILCHEPGRKELLKDPHPRFLRNAVREMNWKGRRFYVAGMDDPVIKRRAGLPNRDLAKTLDGVDPSVPVILLAHSPEVFGEASARGVPLVLCGHNHGGQVAFSPSLRWIYPLEPSLDYPGGFFRKDGSILYVSRGIGTSLLPFRLGIRPEITFLEFEPGGARAGNDRFYRDVSRRGEIVQAEYRVDLFRELLDFAHHFGWNGKTEGKRNSPVLFGFEDASELEGLSRACQVWHERQRRHSTGGAYSLKVEFAPNGPGKIEFTGFRPDWSGYAMLKMDLYNPQAIPVKLWLRVDAPGSQLRPALHHDRYLELRPGLNRISVETESLRGNVTREPLDLTQIDRIMIYARPGQRRTVFHLGGIRLERDGRGGSADPGPEKRH